MSSIMKRNSSGVMFIVIAYGVLIWHVGYRRRTGM